MTTYIKGTFPVRFRRDGKDGTNTWLKYAETLDLTDTSSGKQYPSVMYDEPTSKCMYIGIGKGTGDEPTSGQYYQWTKYVGDDGTSFTPKGSAVAHYTSESAYNSASKSTGYYLVDASPSALLIYWNGSATIAKDSEDGDGYTTSDKHLWVKDGEKWNDLGDIQGPKGDKTYLHTISVNSYSYNGSGCKTALVQVQVESGVSNTTGGSASRGLTIWLISKTSTTIQRLGSYDTYGDSSAADAMASWIESNSSAGSNYFLAITSYGACGFSANLIAALKKWGGSDIADYTPKRQAFSFLGYKGMPEGTAQQVLNIGEDKQAAIFALVNNGICQGKGQDGRSVVSITNLYQRSSDDKNAPSTWLTSSPALDNTNKFLWRRQTIKYTYGSDDVDIQVVGKIGDKGIDGTSVEYIYTRNNTGSTPSTPNTSQTDDYVPSGWYDDPQGVSSSLKYEYVSERRKKNGTWSAFSTPTLWAKWSSDGRGVKSVNTYYALTDNSNGTPADNAFSNDTLSNVVIESNSTKYVWSADKVTYTDGKSEYINKYCIGKCSELTSVTEQYAVTTTLTTPSSWSNNYPTSVAKGSYIWTRDLITWKDGKTSTSTAQITGYIPNDGGQGENGFGIVVSISRDMQYTEAQLNGYFEVGHQDYWSLNSESEKNGCRIGDIFMVWGRSKDKLNSHAAYFRCTDNSQSKRLDGISIRHDIVEKGDKGEAAVTYKLNSSIVSIPLNNDGSPSKTSFTLTPKKSVGSTFGKFNSEYTIVVYISRSGSTTPVTVSYTLDENTKNVSVYLTSNGGSTGTILKDITSVTCTLFHGQLSLDSFTILPVKAGAAGVSYFPNMCGVWDGANVTYKWTNGSRDMVTFYVGGTPYLFAVKTAGTTIKANVNNATPDKDSRWEKADSPFSMLFANFVYTDNASVGGFVYSEEQMRSTSTTDEKSPEPEGSNCNILLNGNTGKFVANYATIRGEVNATSGVFKNVKITNNCWIEPETENGDGWFMRGGNDRIAAWWLGYSGKLTGQFTMNTVYDDGSNHPPTASLSFKTPNIQGGTSDGSTLISAYSNINTPLANFSHAKGMMVRICPSEGVGINFINNAGLATPMAFNGAGHGCLNGVIQGYQLNVITSGQIDISNGNTVYCNGNGTTLILPKLANCRGVLGTTGAFALDLTIIGASGASNFRVYGKYHNSTTDCYLLNNDHGDNWYATMSKGDVLTLKLIYTGSAFYAYIVNLQN